MITAVLYHISLGIKKNRSQKINKKLKFSIYLLLSLAFIGFLINVLLKSNYKLLTFFFVVTNFFTHQLYELFVFYQN